MSEERRRRRVGGWKAVRSLVFLLLLLVTGLGLLVTGPGEARANTVEAVSPSNPRPVETSLSGQIRAQWRVALQGVQEANLKKIHDACLALEELRNKAGYAGLDDYALFLLNEGYRRLGMGDREGAAFFGKKAHQLSPMSPYVALKLLPIVKATGIASVWGKVGFALKNLRSSPLVALSLLKTVIYPFLWALLFALYVSFVIFYAYHIRLVLTSVARWFPPMVRGIVAPVVAFALLSVPCMLGPVWCLVAWSALLLFIAPGRRWLSFHTGVLMILWGLLIPLRENLKSRLDDEGVRSMLMASSGSFSDLDSTRLERLAERRPDDPAALFVYAQQLRREERPADAGVLFERAETLFGKQPWTVAERGAVRYLAGDAAGALPLFEEAERLGLDTPEFLYNYSKVRFDLVDTEGGAKLFSRASAKGRDLVSELKKREELLGARAVAEIRLPPSVLLRSSFRQDAPLGEVERERTNELMKGALPGTLVAAGVALIVAFLVAGNRKGRMRFQSYYTDYRPSPFLESFLRFIPGGAWTIVGRPSTTFFALSFFLFAAFPLVGWPTESTALLDWYPGIRSYYLGALVVLWLAICMRGYSKEQEV